MSDVVREALEEARRREGIEVRGALRRVREILMRIPLEEIVDVVRSSREER